MRRTTLLPWGQLLRSVHMEKTEKLPRQGGLPGETKNSCETVTGVRSCTEAKLTPGSVSCPGAMSRPGIM